ncbi:MAG: alkaline phosphatase family protein [Phycisphaerales bacterium]|jgi:hypothetical protein
MHHYAVHRALRCVAVPSALLLAHAAFAQPVRKVLIFGVDGMRPDVMLTSNTPTFHGLIAHGAFSPTCQAEAITVSGPGWSSILCGVHYTKHNVTNNAFTAPNYSQYPHFFQRLQETCEANTVSIAQWAPINTQICGDRADVTVSNVDGPGVAAACENVLATSNPDVIFLHFDDVDHAGHTYGFGPGIAGYIAAIEGVDTLAGQVLAAVQSRPTIANEDWLVIVTSDHGGTPDGSHGADIPEHRNTGLIVSGFSTAIGTTITPQPELVDVPATVMTFLGLPINPAWGWDGVARGLDLANSPSQPFACVAPPPPPLGASCLPNGDCVRLTLAQCIEQRGVWGGLGSECSVTGCGPAIELFSENFESVVLGPNIDETIAGAAVWSPTPPSGWSINRDAMPNGGVKEWRGWSVASRAWWTQVAGDQGRSSFTKGTGAVAVADPDEWDDLSHSPGLYDTTMSTPPISVAEAAPGTAYLALDSSWIPEGNQAASIMVSYDGGTPQSIAEWASAAGPHFKASAPNETLVLTLNNPEGAQSMVISFRMYNAGNNWWWAMDNLQVLARPAHPPVVLLDEDFEEVPLGPNVDETLSGTHVWSGQPPRDWVFDDSGVTGINNPSLGVTEWKGWAVTNRTWWTQIAADQRRSEFTRGVGAVAVADPDEWDDRGAPSAVGPYNAVMRSPSVSLTNVATDSLQLEFDSSWRPEGVQRAELRAVFDVGSPVVLLNWSSAAGANFHPDATNEHLSLPVPVPPGASEVRLDFSLLDARNNWWWAVDNVKLMGLGNTQVSCDPDMNQDGNADQGDIDYLINAIAGGNNDTGIDPDFNRDGNVDQGDVDALINVIAGGGCP